MRRLFSSSILPTACALTVGVLAAAVPAYAQKSGTSSTSTSTSSSTASGATQWGIDGAVGISLPSSGGWGVGPDIYGAVEAWFPSLHPVGLRGEIGWGDWSYSNSYTGYGNYSWTLSTFRIAVDAVYDFPMHNSKLQPYVLGGLGIYHSSISASGSGCGGLCSVSAGTGTNLGINLGGGVRIPLGSVQGYAELRYQDPFGSSGISFFPLQVGVRYLFK